MKLASLVGCCSRIGIVGWKQELGEMRIAFGVAGVVGIVGSTAFLGEVLGLTRMVGMPVGTGADWEPVVPIEAVEAGTLMGWCLPASGVG